MHAPLKHMTHWDWLLLPDFTFSRSICVVIRVLFFFFKVTQPCPWTHVACRAPLSVKFSRPEYWCGEPFPSPGIFSTQGWNPGLLRWILYRLSHQGSPRILEWVAYPFSRRASWPRNRTGVSCIAGRFFTSWATREAQYVSIPYPFSLPNIPSHLSTHLLMDPRLISISGLWWTSAFSHLGQ